MDGLYLNQIPNGIGTMFAVVQLILYASYYKSTQEQIAARKNNGKGEMNLSEVVVGMSNTTVQDIPNNNNKITTIDHVSPTVK